MRKYALLSYVFYGCLVGGVATLQAMPPKSGEPRSWAEHLMQIHFEAIRLAQFPDSVFLVSENFSALATEPELWVNGVKLAQESFHSPNISCILVPHFPFHLADPATGHVLITLGIRGRLYNLLAEFRTFASPAAMLLASENTDLTHFRVNEMVRRAFPGGFGALSGLATPRLSMAQGPVLAPAAAASQRASIATPAQGAPHHWQAPAMGQDVPAAAAADGDLDLAHEAESEDDDRPGSGPGAKEDSQYELASGAYDPEDAEAGDEDGPDLGPAAGATGSSAAAAGQGARPPLVRPFRRSQYSAKARSVMTNWFRAHVAKPYPTDEEKQALCQEADVTLITLNNWFTNTRKRYWWKHPTNPELNELRATRVLKNGPDHQAKPRPSQPQAASAAKRGTKRSPSSGLIPKAPEPKVPWHPRASAVLMAWATSKEHIADPYPSDLQKHELAQAAGVTYDQVLAWFINYRGRRWGREAAKQGIAFADGKDQQHPGTKAAGRSRGKAESAQAATTKKESKAESDSDYEATDSKPKRARQ